MVSISSLSCMSELISCLEVGVWVFGFSLGPTMSTAVRWTTSRKRSPWRLLISSWTAETCLKVGRSGSATRTITRTTGGFCSQSISTFSTSTFSLSPKVKVCCVRNCSIVFSTESRVLSCLAWLRRLIKPLPSGISNKPVSAKFAAPKWLRLSSWRK